MKYNKFLTILFASGLLGIAVACTDNFEADNRNNTGFDSELQEYDFQKYLLKFEIIQSGIYFNYDWGEGKNWTFQIAQNLGQDMFSGYFHDLHYARSTEVRTNQRRAACAVSCNPNIEG